MAKPRLIITGSKGKIGKVLCEYLSGEFEILEIDKAPFQYENYFQADISDFVSILSAFQEIVKAKYLIHLAAASNASANWTSVLPNNIVGTKNVYECARLFNIQKVIFASSLHACWPFNEFSPSQNNGTQTEFEIEQKFVRPDCDYGASKVFGEALARQYFELFGIYSICLRIGFFSGFNTIPENIPEQFKKIHLKKDNLAQLFERSLSTKVKFGILSGISNGIEQIYSILDTESGILQNPSFFVPTK